MSEINQRRLENTAILACVQIGKLLTSTTSHEEILTLIMAQVSQLVKADNWSLFLLDEETNELRFEIVVGIDKKTVEHIRIPLGVGLVGHAAKTGQPLIINDAQTNPRFNREIDRLTGFKTHSVICVPLTFHNRIQGVIEIVNIADPESFEIKYMPIVKILSDYAAIALENARLFNRIQQLSVTDEYTGLYNARYLHQILDDFLIRTDEQGQSLAVVFMDVDNFKQVVDKYGHLSGSRVLKEIGTTIRDRLQESDILIKYGGDEYVMILPDHDRDKALTKIETIRGAIQESRYLNNEGMNISVTASFGIAIYPADAKNKKDILLAADNLMYEIKRSRKNGVALTMSAK